MTGKYKVKQETGAFQIYQRRTGEDSSSEIQRSPKEQLFLKDKM